MSNSVQDPIQQSAVFILIAAMADVGMDEQEWMKLVEEMDAMVAAEEAAEKAEQEQQPGPGVARAGR